LSSNSLNELRPREVRKHPKVGVLIDRMSPGAVAKIAIEEVRNFLELGIDARLVVLMEEKVSGYRYEDILAEIDIDWLSRGYPSLFRRSFRFPLFSFFSTCHVTCPFVTAKYTSKLDYDALLVHGTYTCFTAYRIWKARGIPYIAYIHDPISYIIPRVHQDSRSWPFFLPLAHLGKRLDKAILAGSVGTIVNSSQTRKRVEPYAGKTPVEVIYPGCHPATSIPSQRGEYILSITKWDKGKRPDFLLELMQAVPRVAKLYVTGFWVGDLRASFLENVKRTGLQERVVVLSPQDEDAIRSLYLNARCVIHPITEAYGMSTMEAASCGCPSIIPKGSGATELFKDGIHSFTPTEGNISEFAQCLAVLNEDERKAWQMGQDGWNISKLHTWEDHALKLIDVISSAV